MTIHEYKGDLEYRDILFYYDVVGGTPDDEVSTSLKEYYLDYSGYQDYIFFHYNRIGYIPDDEVCNSVEEYYLDSPTIIGY